MTVGHGSPHVLSQESPFAFCKRRRWEWIAALAMVMTAVTNAALAQQSDAGAESRPAAEPMASASDTAAGAIAHVAASEKLAFELRIVWGGGAPRAYQGNISIDNGSIKLVRNLSLQADSIGAISSTGNSSLKVVGHSSSTFGGADVMIEGTANSRVTMQFVHPTLNQPVEHSFVLSEILADRWLRKLDEQGNRIAAERQMQDRLRVRPRLPQSIFPVDSTWHAALSGYRCGLPAGEYHLLIKLLDQAKGDAIVSEQEQTVMIDQLGNFETFALEVPLPQVESSYAIEFILNRKRFLQSFVSSTHSLKRRVDLVVFDYKAKPNRIEYWTPIATIQPLNSQWWSAKTWFSTLGSTQPFVQLPAFSEHSKRLVNHGSQSSRKVGDQDCRTLGPKSWQAYPLAIEHLGQPHRLRVRVPCDRAQQLVISVRDYHTSGEPTTLNVDSAIVLGERQVASQAKSAGLWADHEIVFWPRSLQPVLLMLNASSTEEAAFGELQLEVGQLEPVAPPNAIRAHVSQTESNDSKRMVALYLTKPLMADAFGAQRNVDPLTKRALDSWLTWQQSAERLTQYMQNAGYNTLILDVAGDGGSVLPLARLAATARFDSGTFYSDGRSPEIKDFVELLCNHLDRAGLKLMLTLDLNSHLPGLAKWEADETQVAGMYQVDFEGKAWQFDTDASNRRVLYNPLHPKVQSELEQIIRDVSNRYALHPCFKGLTFDLDEGSHLVFAGDRWGYDELTLQRFEAATQSKLLLREPVSTSMQGALRLAFLNWRARELSIFYVRLADAVQNAKADAHLLLNPVPLWQRQPSQHDYIDAVAASRNLSDVLLAAGLDTAWLKQQQHVAILRGQSECALGSDLERAWLSRAASDAGMVYGCLGNSSGTVQLQRPTAILIPEANKLHGSAAHGSNPIPSSGNAWCYPIAASLGPQVRKNFIEQLYREDSLLVADGTWMPPQSDSLQLTEFRKTLVELPNAPMQTVKTDRDDNNVRLRSVKTGNDTYLQLINNASWTERVTMDVKIADIRSVYEVLGGKELTINGATTSNRSSSRIDANGSRASTVWQFDVPPYEMIGFKISDPQFKLNNFIHSPDPSLIEAMKVEIDALENRMSTISDTARLESLDVPGGDFEQWVDGSRPVGWTVSSLPQVSIRQENALPHSGLSCVAIENRNQAQVSAWMQSEQIRIPESGRLVVSAWVRAPAVGNTPQVLRLSLIGRTRDGRRYQRMHQFAAQTANSELPVDWGKRPMTLFVTDLPSAELTELYVAFDLVGPGKVWVDDIQAVEAYLSPEERVQIRGQIFLAKEKLRDNNAFPAEQVLNSHLARYLASINPRPVSTSQVNPTQVAQPEKPVSGNRWNNSPPILYQLRESVRERWQK